MNKKSTMKSDNVVISELKKSTFDKQEKQLKISVAGIPGEYFYDHSVSRLELQDISFNGLYLKLPQVIPEGEIFDIRFSLKLGDPVLWATVAIVKTYETNIYVEFIDIPPITRKTIELFIDQISNRNINRLLTNKP